MFIVIGYSRRTHKLSGTAQLNWRKSYNAQPVGYLEFSELSSDQSHNSSHSCHHHDSIDFEFILAIKKAQVLLRDSRQLPQSSHCDMHFTKILAGTLATSFVYADIASAVHGQGQHRSNHFYLDKRHDSQASKDITHSQHEPTQYPHLVARTDPSKVLTYIGSACGAALVVERVGKYVWNEKIPSAQKEKAKLCVVNLYNTGRRVLRKQPVDRNMAIHDLEAGGSRAHAVIETIGQGAGAGAGVA
ncbi:hypothetical protein K461DRAFT_319889 [Myriangium duriaei CBS 260.36]|uniref:Uncharacterized protein n=1 Tax=Myriangium duriaei CBS 260.36 TaxID=1168546 RepID=A0A9P4J548_9PEZI|nr:hypothetical protein K461DRAFT_319889 [Myriangium duriaei CBS 260.36]